MLRLEKTRSETTVQIKILNRLFYLIALDGLSREEAARLWHELIERMWDVLGTTEEEARGKNKWLIHYLWWKRQKVSVIFITGDIVDQLEANGKALEDLLAAIADFETEEVKIPFCSANAVEGWLSGNNNDNNLSRVSLGTNDDDGEIIVHTTEEICRAAFRR